MMPGKAINRNDFFLNGVSLQETAGLTQCEHASLIVLMSAELDSDIWDCVLLPPCSAVKKE